MRRLMAFVLITLMLLTPLLPIGAKTIKHSQGVVQNPGIATDGSVVKHGVSEEFTVIIPAKVDMIKDAVVSASVGVENVHLPRAKTVQIRVSGSHGIAGSPWRLQSEFTNTGVYCTYSVAMTEGGESINSQTTVLSYNISENTTASKSQNLYFTPTEEPTLGGQYLDQMSFTVYIVS